MSNFSKLMMTFGIAGRLPAEFTISILTGFTIARLAIFLGISASAAIPIFWIIAGVTGYNFIKGEFVLGGRDDGRIEKLGIIALRTLAKEAQFILAERQERLAAAHLATIHAQIAVEEAKEKMSQKRFGLVKLFTKLV